MKKVLKYISLVLVSLTVIVTIAGILVAWYYQDEVRQLMIGELNRNLRTEISVSDISFSVLRKFPNASIEFKDVLIKVPEGYKYDVPEYFGSDTLFSAKIVFLQFSVAGIFRGDYRITGMSASDGVLNLNINSKGEENYRFWNSEGDSEGSVNIDLEDIRINNYRLIYASHLEEIYFESDIRRMQMKGNLGKSRYHFRGIATGNNRLFRNRDFTLSGSQEISVRLTVLVDDRLIGIEKGDIVISGLNFNIEGVYDRGEFGNIDLAIQGTRLDFGSAIGLLPESLQHDLEPYSFSGMLDFKASVKRPPGENGPASLYASFIAERGEIVRRETGMRLKDIAIEGYYSGQSLNNPGYSTFVINNFSSDFGRGSLKGSGRIAGSGETNVDFNINAFFYLDELAEFYKPGNIVQMAGEVNTAFSARGFLKERLKWDIEELNKMDLNGILEIRDGMLEISEGKYIASSIEGELYFGSTLRTPSLSFNIGSDHFSINGEIDNGLPWLLGHNETMRVSGNLFSSNLTVDNYLYAESGNQGQGSNDEPLLFPSSVELNLDFLVENLKFRKFNSTGFSGRLSYKPYMVVLNTVEFNTCEGNVAGNGVIAQNLDGDFIVQSQLMLQGVDMQQMFHSFNNFGQTFIHGDNLKGKLNGNLGFISEWSRDLQLKRDKIIADTKFEINNGELIGFEPVMGLARFIDLSELQHIHFSNLKNEIFIRHQVVTIPQMDINSSAFNISGSGNHRFDGNFDYRLRVLLSDVLYGKAKKSKPENIEFGIVEDDGLGRTSLHLLVSGTPDDYRVSYDHRAVREVIRNNIASERALLRNMLNQEFGWFSSDTTSLVKPAPRESQNPGFRITWDESDEKPSVNNPAQVRPENNSRNNRRRFQITWDEEEPDNLKPGR